MNIQDQVFYSGVVESRRDPLFLGRCQVRIVGLHTEEKSELPTDALPWAYPLQSITSAAMNGIGHSPVGPVEGTWVMLIFRDNEKQQPVIIGTLGGIPQQDNNANIQRDEDGYLINSDNFEPMFNSSGVPIRNQNGTSLIAGLPGGYIGGQGGLTISVAELEAAMQTEGVNVTRIDKNVIAGSLSSVSGGSGLQIYPSARTLSSDSPYSDGFTSLNRVANTLGKFQTVDTATLTAFLNTLEQSSRITGTLIGDSAKSTVGLQIQNQITGFSRTTSQLGSTAANITSDLGRIQNSVSSVNVAFGTLQGSVSNLGNSFNQLGAAFNNPGFRSVGLKSIGLGGIGNGINAVAGTAQRVVGAVQTGLRIANTAVTLANQAVQVGRAINNKLGLPGGDASAFAVGAIAGIALRNPKIAAVVNAIVRTKAAIDTINRVVGKYTGGAIGSIAAGRLFTPLSLTNETRLINSGALVAGIPSKLETGFTAAGAIFSTATGSIVSKVQEVTGKIGEVVNKINQVAAAVSEVAGDVSTVVNAVGDAAGAWGAVGTAFGAKKGGSRASITFQQTGSVIGQVQLIGGNIQVGTLQENDLNAFRDGQAFYKTSSVPGALQNFNVNGVIGGQNYGVISPLGQLGKYQINSEQLTSTGYVRFLTNLKGERVFPSNFRLARGDVWTGKNGINGVQKFISTPEVQEFAMLEITALNYQELVRQEIITEKTSSEEISGFLSIAHNKGVSAVRQFIEGINVQDITGSTGFQDFSVGFASLSGKTAVVVPGNAPMENRDTNIPPIGERDANGNVSFGRKLVGDEGIGFRDPEKKYPLQEKLNEPDTNRLARNQFIGKTIVTLKEANKDTKVIIAGTGQTWDQPDSPYDSVYPFNHTYESESGHIVELDDTPNRERMHWYHRKGTFEEWDPNGTCVRRIVGDSYEIIDRNGFVHVRGNCNITVDGDANLMVRSNATVEVLGNTTGFFRNDVNLEVSGEMNMTVKEDFNLKAKNITFETTGSSSLFGAIGGLIGATPGAVATDGFLKMIIRGPVNLAAENDINVVARNNILMQALDNVGISSSNDFNITSGENFDLTALTGGVFITSLSPLPDRSTVQISAPIPGIGRVNVTSGLSMNFLALTGVMNLNAMVGQINIRTPTTVAIDGSTAIFLNSGVSGPAVPATPALPSTSPRGLLPLIPTLPDLVPKSIAGIPTGLGTYTQLPLASVRGTPVNPRLDIKTLPPRGISSDQFFETPEDGDSTQFRSNQVQRGRLSENIVPTERESSEFIPATPKQGKIPVGCGVFAQMTEFPISTRLSANFYLGDFLTPTPGGTNAYICAATTPQRLTDSADGSKAEILCNLKGFADNIMEKIITVTPKSEILVTSGYRVRGSIGAIESTNSDHPRGCAVDIVLRNFGGNRRKHYELALELERILPYDQLFLEYAGTATRGAVWIHIGHRAFQSSQRGIVGTVVGHSFRKPPSELGKIKFIN